MPANQYRVMETKSSYWLEPGERAPAFNLTADDGSKVRLSGLKGRPVVLYFHPRDDTPGCTQQLLAALAELT